METGSKFNTKVLVRHKSIKTWYFVLVQFSPGVLLHFHDRFIFADILDSETEFSENRYLIFTYSSKRWKWGTFNTMIRTTHKEQACILPTLNIPGSEQRSTNSRPQPPNIQTEDVQNSRPQPPNIQIEDVQNSRPQPPNIQIEDVQNSRPQPPNIQTELCWMLPPELYHHQPQEIKQWFNNAELSFRVELEACRCYSRLHIDLAVHILVLQTLVYHYLTRLIYAFICFIL